MRDGIALGHGFFHSFLEVAHLDHFGAVESRLLFGLLLGGGWLFVLGRGFQI